MISSIEVESKKREICCCVTREAIEIFHRTIGFTYYNVYTVVKVQVAQF